MGVGEADRDRFFRHGILMGKLGAKVITGGFAEAGQIDGDPDQGRFFDL